MSVYGKEFIARPLDEWHEDMGDVLWFRFPIEEAPYVGTPNDIGREVRVTFENFEYGSHVDGPYVRKRSESYYIGGWPGYHTHWLPLPKVVSPDV